MPVAGIADIRAGHEAEQEFGQRLTMPVTMRVGLCAGTVRVRRLSRSVRMLVRRLACAMRMPRLAPSVTLAVRMSLAGLVAVAVSPMGASVLVRVVLIRRPLLVRIPRLPVSTVS
jgi:hypothetical protein